MLNQLSLDNADPVAQRALVNHFELDLLRGPFNYKALSGATHPTYAFGQDLAYAWIRAYCHASGHPERIGRFAADYYADTAFEASALTRGDVHLVAISAGAPALLLALFLDLVASTNFLAVDYADADSPVTPGDYRFPLRLPPRPDSDLALADLIDQTIQDAVPKHRWQRVWAVTFAELALGFVFGHELGHIIRGHTTVLDLRRGGRVSEGSRRLAKDRATPRLRQAWELEADEMAFSLLWSYAVTTKRHRERLIRRLHCAHDGHPVVTLVSRLMYAISFVFFIFGQLQEQVDAVGNHPSALTRVTFLMALSQQLLEQQMPDVSPALLVMGLTPGSQPAADPRRDADGGRRAADEPD